MKKIIGKYKLTKALGRKVEEKIYSQIFSEMASGYIRNGLWAKAIQSADGDIEKQIARYIKFRFQSLTDDIEITKQLNQYPSFRSIFSGNNNNLISYDNGNIHDFISKASKYNDIEQIIYLTKKMAAHEIVEKINTPDDLDDYPIHIAARNGSEEVLLWLIENGANLNMTNCWNLTALQVAEKANQLSIVEILEARV
ncbi:ankyrin repeat domain-containing protein [Endozoicomonas gorgoniicola]|uniref:Ankyrin repeat domain-containing protein n=1 Tax=Endozoicomonas gorgoniicola TaxID=1234144 RepID=A0ABT3MQH3_9GAMM|nr:ankyrin repeat domain-containing protein [Endozoicomonas gorgoniicola]MCW7551607.1 ankyrin repeat domain-containing protein [Endozoicomonas gorgoniicola]